MGVTARAGGRRAPTRSLRIGLPFVAVHVACIGVIVVGWSPVALCVCLVLYVVRAFGITVSYHRQLAHRAFRTPRVLRALGAVSGAAAAQRGPLWWVAHHRVHHRHTDRPGDPHSPVVAGLVSAHLLWLFEAANQPTDLRQVPDLAGAWELRLLDRFHHLVPALLAAATFALGAVLGSVDPGLGTSGPQMLVWGFCVSTVALYHSTFAVNSLGHRYGRRRFETPDASRNNRLVALLTLGEGWHNNHHRYPPGARQGLGRSEPDPSWWVIRGMVALGLATHVRTVPERILSEAGLGVDGAARGSRGGASGLDGADQVGAVGT